jgi:hypothetical protein
VKFINDKIKSAPLGSPLKAAPLVKDPSEEIIAVHVAALEWNLKTREFGLKVSDMPNLQDQAVELLELLKSNMPEKSGQANGWKFEKAHSILHKVREILLFGWPENFSGHGPEHCHIPFLKKVARCTNNKDMFLTIIRYHARLGYLNYLAMLQDDLADAKREEADGSESDDELDAVQSKIRGAADIEDTTSCELGFRYPLLKAIIARDCAHQTLQVAPMSPRCRADVGPMSGRCPPPSCSNLYFGVLHRLQATVAVDSVS